MKVFDCPECQAPRGVDGHCESPRCEWVRCKSCRFVVDTASGNSFKPDRQMEGWA